VPIEVRESFYGGGINAILEHGNTRAYRYTCVEIDDQTYSRDTIVLYIISFANSRIREYNFISCVVYNPYGTIPVSGSPRTRS
jgi:hypothetical protein